MIPLPSTTDQLLNLAAVLVALSPAVLIAWALARWLRRRSSQAQHLGTGTVMRRYDGAGVFVCDLCSTSSPPSRSKPLLRDWARQHAGRYHPSHADLGR